MLYYIIHYNIQYNTNIYYTDLTNNFIYRFIYFIDLINNESKNRNQVYKN